ncbi:MAG: glycosyltransferase family 9 protein, partial [Nitrososphaerota archaeon]|nr:glycosyltransferase family 9 protein [Nitrososphaerota archaeon]
MNRASSSYKVFPEVQRVLLHRLGSLGDTVVALPALHLVAAAFPNAKRVLLTNRPVHAKAPSASVVIGESGLVNDYIEYPVGTRSLTELLRLWRQIIQFRPEWIIYLAEYKGKTALKRDEWFFRTCGARKMIGFHGDAVVAPLYCPEEGLWEHQAPRLLRRLKEIGTLSCSDLSSWDLHLTDAEQERAKSVLAPLASRPFLVCGPGTKMPAKDWGGDKWFDLMQ